MSYPGAFRWISPSGPPALNFTAQSRTICNVTPPIHAASVRLALHRLPPARAGVGFVRHPRLPRRGGAEIGARRDRHGKLQSICHLESARDQTGKSPRVTISDPWYKSFGYRYVATVFATSMPGRDWSASSMRIRKIISADYRKCVTSGLVYGICIRDPVMAPPPDGSSCGGSSPQPSSGRRTPFERVSECCAGPSAG